MTTKRTGYLMAMLAGLAIVGASTGGVVAATSHHDIVLAAEQSSAAAALQSSATASAGISPSPVSAPILPGPASAAAGAPAAAPTSAATQSPSTPSRPARASGAVAPAPPVIRSSQDATAPASPTNSSKPVAPTVATVALKYKNGQYSATGSYNCPSGIEKIGVTITLASDKVISSNLDLLGGAGLSHSFQESFQSGYSPQVIGKDIDSVSIGTVSGSSLTSAGFNDALKQIESQAKT